MGGLCSRRAYLLRGFEESKRFISYQGILNVAPRLNLPDSLLMIGKLSAKGNSCWG